MAYRDDVGDRGEARTAAGLLRIDFAPRHVKLAVGPRSLEIVDGFATVIEPHRVRSDRERRQSLRIAGRLVVARGVPRESLGVWIEVEPGTPDAGFRRLFGVEPASLLEASGLAALASLDRLAARLRHALAHHARDVRRASELGPHASGGLDKVLVLDDDDRTVVFARKLFRDRARRVLEAGRDGAVFVRDPRRARGAPPAEGRDIVVRSRHAVTVTGDNLRFTDAHGGDLAKLALPWIAFEDRVELARRIGQRIDHDLRDAVAWPPRLFAEGDPA